MWGREGAERQGAGHATSRPPVEFINEHQDKSPILPAPPGPAPPRSAFLVQANSGTAPGRRGREGADIGSSSAAFRSVIEC